MQTINKNITNTIIINKSIFITDIVSVTSKEDALAELNKIKEKHKDASHYCYAYIIDDIKKSSDDNEPGGTAGIIMMEVLNKFSLNYTLCVVTRYFGGIKLGTGGLIRAYRKSVVDTLTLNKSNIVPIIDGFEITIKVSYSKQKEVEYLIKDNYTKKYDDLVEYTIKCDSDTFEKIKSKYDILNVKKIKLY